LIKKTGIILALLTVLILQVSGQKTIADSTFVKPPEHSPKKATLYSTFLPGLGQAYNKKYWKIPIIYAGFGAIVYFIGWNNDYYILYKSAYTELTSSGFDKETYVSHYPKIKNLQYFDLSDNSSISNLKTGLLNSKDYYRRNRDLLIISTAAFYALNIIDASVDAHLYNFDISDDLTFNWQPSVGLFENQRIYCLNCTLNF